jgi:hypothetical protein
MSNVDAGTLTLEQLHAPSATFLLLRKRDMPDDLFILTGTRTQHM